MDKAQMPAAANGTDVRLDAVIALLTQHRDLLQSMVALLEDAKDVRPPERKAKPVK